MFQCVCMWVCDTLLSNLVCVLASRLSPERDRGAMTKRLPRNSTLCPGQCSGVAWVETCRKGKGGGKEREEDMMRRRVTRNRANMKDVRQEREDGGETRMEGGGAEVGADEIDYIIDQTVVTMLLWKSEHSC